MDNRKRDELYKYSALSEIMLDLKKHGYIDQLHRLFLNVYHDETKRNCMHLEKVKEGIKAVVDGLLEEI